jgi:hypothetical protein
MSEILVNCIADILSIQNYPDASQDDDAVNVSSFRRRCVYAYRLRAIAVLSLRNELQLIKHYISYTFIQINLLKPTGHVMDQQFNIQQMYALPTLYVFIWEQTATCAT